MSSPGHWEVVSKNKKSKQNGQSSSKLSKAEKKKFAENAPKVEDILPLAQVKNLYTDEVASDVQEPKKPKETKLKEEPKKVKEKKQPEKKKDQKEKIQKQTSELDEGQLLAFISEAQSCYSEVPLAWLRDFASYITTRLAQAQLSSLQGSGKTIDKWPSSLLPPKVCKTIESVLLEESESAQVTFFSACLTSLANDMSKKGHLALGQRILLQIHINSNPQIVGMNVDKLIALRNSYQNRPPICLALLEIIGQAGYKDISTGIKVWSEIMFPLIEMRHYSRWVVSYLGNLTAVHTDGLKDGAGNSSTKSSLPLASLLSIVSKVLPIGNSLTSQLQKELLPFLGSLRAVVVEQSEQEELEDLFSLYLPKLVQSSPKFVQNEVLDGLMQCLMLEPSCFAVWQDLYDKYLPNSVILLQHISNSPMKTSLIGDPLCQCLRAFESMNLTLMARGEDKVKSSCADFSWEDLNESSSLIQEYLEKAKSSPKAKGFPFIKGSLLCLLGIIGLITYDVRKHNGSFRDSSVGHLASDIGALPTIEIVVSHVQHIYSQAYEFLELNGPVYYKAVSEVVGPILTNGIEAASHITSCVYKYMMELYPVIINWIDDQFPGFRDKCAEYLSHGWVLFQSYSWWALDQCYDYTALGIQWAKENIFVGRLSAENLQKLSMEAYNMTQLYAGLTIEWVTRKMQ